MNQLNFKLNESTGFDNMRKHLANRRSTRNFKDNPIPNDVISKIINSIYYAPYGAEPEKVNITVVNNRKRKEGTERFNTIKNHLYPISRSGNYKLELGDRITRGAPALIILHAEKGAEEHTNNSLIYATYLILTAHSLGLGATMIGIVPAAINKVSEVKEIFKIPARNEAIISVIIGYPQYKYKRTIKRQNNPVKWID